MKKNATMQALPCDVKRLVEKLGYNVKISRLQRNMTQQKLAEAMFATRQTVARLEAGDAGISLGMFFTAVFCLRRLDECKGMLSPENDLEGLMLERRRLLSRRGGHKEAEDSSLDF